MQRRQTTIASATPSQLLAAEARPIYSAGGAEDNRPRIPRRRAIMPTYISLVQYTQKGIEAIKESPKRLDAARKTFEEAGAKIKDFYLVMGEYDIIFVAEAPNDEAVAKLALILGSK